MFRFLCNTGKNGKSEDNPELKFPRQTIPEPLPSGQKSNNRIPDTKNERLCQNAGTTPFHYPIARIMSNFFLKLKSEPYLKRRQILIQTIIHIIIVIQFLITVIHFSYNIIRKVIIQTNCK